MRCFPASVRTPPSFPVSERLNKSAGSLKERTSKEQKEDAACPSGPRRALFHQAGLWKRKSCRRSDGTGGLFVPSVAADGHFDEAARFDPVDFIAEGIDASESPSEIYLDFQS